MAILKELYMGDTTHHGTGTVSADSTAEQFMKVTGSDEYAPQTAPDGAYARLLKEDRLADARCDLMRGGVLYFSNINGSPTVGNEIEIGTDAFATKHTTHTARGLIINHDGTNYWVVMY